jgi:hypothetical protein
MSAQQYALLDPTLQNVVEIDTIDTAIYAAWQAAANPKATQFLPVNMIAQPGFNPATQQVIQNGWTITAVDVQPVWVVQALTTAQLTANTAQANWQAAVALNLVTGITTALNNWGTLTPAQKDVLLQDVLKVLRGMLQITYGINN